MESRFLRLEQGKSIKIILIFFDNDANTLLYLFHDSLPNYIASKVAAEKGFGNMAVSNAFGSNTFNIMIGLGLPWLLYTSVGTGPYSGLRDDGITQSVMILILCLLVFIVVVLHSGFVLYRWHGYLFITLYVAYIVFSIAQVYML